MSQSQDRSHDDLAISVGAQHQRFQEQQLILDDLLEIRFRLLSLKVLKMIHLKIIFFTHETLVHPVCWTLCFNRDSIDIFEMVFGLWTDKPLSSELKPHDDFHFLYKILNKTLLTNNPGLRICHGVKSIFKPKYCTKSSKFIRINPSKSFVKQAGLRTTLSSHSKNYAARKTVFRTLESITAAASYRNYPPGQ